LRSIAERKVADVVILDLTGESTFGGLKPEVTERVRTLMRAGQTKFVLNLQDVSYLDSSGLGDLAGAHQAAAKEGAQLKISGVQPRISDLLRTVNLLRVFEIFESEPQALKSFQA
jgi:anti-anti-sigma factor